jgi:hypothetical protein
MTPPASSDGRFLADGVEVDGVARNAVWCLTTERVMRELKVDRPTLAAHELGSDLLDGEPLAFTWTHSPDTGMPVKVCPEVLVERVKTRMHEVRQGRFVTKRGIAFLSLKKTLEKLKVGKGAQVKPGSLTFYLKYTWRNEPTAHLRSKRHPEGQRLRAEIFSFFKKGELWFAETHILRIRRSFLREAKRGSRPKPTTARPPRKLRPIEQWKGVIDEPAGRRLSMPKAVERLREMGLPVGPRLWRWLRKLPKLYHQAFPESHLPWEWRRVPGSGQRIRTVLETDLGRLVAAYDVATSKTVGDRTGLTALDLCDHHGISRHGDRIRTRRALLEMARQDILPAKEETRCHNIKAPPPGADILRRHYRVFTFDPRAINRFLGGRKLLDIVACWERGDPVEASSLRADQKVDAHHAGGRKGPGRPSAIDKHRQWLEEHEAGRSLSEIAESEDVTRRAVIDGIRKAREALAREVNSRPN